MVVACRSQQILASSKHISLSKGVNVVRYTNTAGLVRLLDRNTIRNRQSPISRLCSCRNFHNSREPRSAFAKLTPQELIGTSLGNFTSQCPPGVTSNFCTGCDTFMFCMWGLNFGGIKTCTQPNGPKQYCNPKTNQCQATPPEECNPIPSGFQCQQIGTFPDLSSCSKYINCGEDRVPKIQNCTGNFVYNYTFGKCVTHLDNSDCPKISCSSVDETKVYTDKSSVYYECKSSVPQLRVCPKFEVFSATKKACENICTNPGLLPNSQDCKKYIECSDNLTAVERTCPSGQGFNPLNKRCQIGYEVLCNEQAILFQKIPMPIRFLSNFVLSAIQNINNTMHNILVQFNINQDVLSTTMLTVNYFFEHGTIPPFVMNEIFDSLLNLVPANIRPVVEAILKNIINIRPMSFLNFQSNATILSDQSLSPREVSGPLVPIIDIYKNIAGSIKNIFPAINTVLNFIVDEAYRFVAVFKSDPLISTLVQTFTFMTIDQWLENINAFKLPQ